MTTKKEIVSNWLPRYTGTSVEEFGQYIILTNFKHYIDLFAKWNNVPIHGENKAMPSATCDNITIIDFSMGSANAATIMDFVIGNFAESGSVSW